MVTKAIVDIIMGVSREHQDIFMIAHKTINLEEQLVRVRSIDTKHKLHPRHKVALELRILTLYNVLSIVSVFSQPHIDLWAWVDGGLKMVLYFHLHLGSRIDKV